MVFVFSEDWCFRVPDDMYSGKRCLETVTQLEDHGIMRSSDKTFGQKIITPTWQFFVTFLGMAN